MPEDVLVESSPATPEATPAEVPADPAAYAEWRMSGKVPEPKQKQQPKQRAESAPAEADQPDTPASEADEPRQEKPPAKRDNAASRLQELLADLRTAGYTPAELKTLRRAEAKAAEAEPPKQQASEKPAPEAPAKPKEDDFSDWQEYKAAEEKYIEDLAEYKAERAVQRYRQEQQERAAAEHWTAKMAEAKTRYGDEAGPAITAAAREINADKNFSPIVRTMLDASSVAIDVLYVLAAKPDEFQEFMRQSREDPAGAVRRVVLVERLVQDELAQAGSATPVERDESGRFVKGTPPVKPPVKAPPPPRETSGRAAPVDEIETATKANDFASYRSAANRRDIATRKGL